jgi:CDP-2,3-bis-(O-geranylgeranyl)-sn-glycerol synthase
MDLPGLLGSAIWFILPAYIANATPVVLGGGPPIDGGRKFINGHPIFGAGKTIRGFFAGFIAGSLVGLTQTVLVGGSPLQAPTGALLAAGALTGDLLGSFIKRRLDLPRGKAAPGLDQLGFLMFAVLFAAPLMMPTLEIFIALLLVTPPIHLAANYCGYKFRLKEKPY